MALLCFTAAVVLLPGRQQGQGSSASSASQNSWLWKPESSELFTGSPAPPNTKYKKAWGGAYVWHLFFPVKQHPVLPAWGRCDGAGGARPGPPACPPAEPPGRPDVSWRRHSSTAPRARASSQRAPSPQLCRGRRGLGRQPGYWAQHFAMHFLFTSRLCIMPRPRRP